MPAGAYIVESRAGEFTFQLSGDAWTFVAYIPEILSLRAEDEWIAFMSGEIRLRKGDEVEMTSKAQRAQNFLASLRGISVTAIEGPQQVDGLDAVVFDVFNEGNRTTQMWGLGLTSGQYTLDPGAAVRMIWVDVDGTPFVIALEAPAAQLPDFVAETAAMVESVTFD